MQDLASEFSKLFRFDIPDPHSWSGRHPPAPNTQPGLWLTAPQTFLPLNFSAVVAPLRS